MAGFGPNDTAAVGAPWPGNDPAQPGITTQGLTPQQWRQFNILRRRMLTLGGNATNLAVTLAATSVAVVFSRQEADLNYGVSATPSWATTVWITAKSRTGYTVNFGTGAPASATVDVLTFRSE